MMEETIREKALRLKNEAIAYAAMHPEDSLAGDIVEICNAVIATTDSAEEHDGRL
jgi:hypothetical protein